MALSTDNIRQYYIESCQIITSHAIITNGYYPLVINIQTDLPTDNIWRYYTESCHTITTDAIITDGLFVSNYR